MLGLGKLLKDAKVTNNMLGDYTELEKFDDGIEIVEGYVTDGYQFGIRVGGVVYTLMHCYYKDGEDFSEFDVRFYKKGRKHYIAIVCMVKVCSKGKADYYRVHYLFDNSLEFIERICEFDHSEAYKGVVDETFDVGNFGYSNEIPVDKSYQKHLLK